MRQRQKAVVVMAEPGKAHGLDELNLLLGRGWRVVTATSMGGADAHTDKASPGPSFAALVIVEFAGDLAAEFLEQVQQPEELPEETGDGSSYDVGDSGL